MPLKIDDFNQCHCKNPGCTAQRAFVLAKNAKIPKGPTQHTLGGGWYVVATARVSQAVNGWVGELIYELESSGSVIAVAARAELPSEDEAKAACHDMLTDPAVEDRMVELFKLDEDEIRRAQEEYDADTADEDED